MTVRERHAAPRQVLQAAAGRPASLKGSRSPDVERAFRRDFVKRAGGHPGPDVKRAAADRAKKRSARDKKNDRASSDDVPF